MRPVAVGLQAALMLARGRAEGLSMLGSPPDQVAVARRSFWAVAVCLPAFVCLHLLDQKASGAAASSARAFAADLCGFVIGWLAFALASHRVANVLGRGEHWLRFITLWNWCNVVQYVMLVVAALPGLLGLPEVVSQTAWLVALGWALWLEWFMTGLALSVPAPMAAALVVLDVGIGLFVASVTG
jgi:hypothetical protein